MKTVVIWNASGEVNYYVVDGDLSHLDGLYLDGGDTEAENELRSIMYDDNKHKWPRHTAFPIQEVLHGAKVILAGIS